MSFGFSVSDFAQTLALATTVARAIRYGPIAYNTLRAETSAVRTLLQRLTTDASNSASLLILKGAPRRNELLTLIASCTDILKQAQQFIDAHSSLQAPDRSPRTKRIWDAFCVGSAELDGIATRLTFFVSCISAWLQSLEGPAIARIESKVDRLCAKLLSDEASGSDSGSSSAGSLMSVAESIRSRLESDEEDVWREVRSALAEEELSLEDLGRYRSEVVQYLKGRLDEGIEGVVDAPATDEQETTEPQCVLKTEVPLSDPMTDKWQWRCGSDGQIYPQPNLGSLAVSVEPRMWGFYDRTIPCFCLVLHVYALPDLSSQGASQMACKINLRPLPKEDHHSKDTSLRLLEGPRLRNPLPKSRWYLDKRDRCSEWEQGADFSFTWHRNLADASAIGLTSCSFGVCLQEGGTDWRGMELTVQLSAEGHRMSATPKTADFTTSCSRPRLTEWDARWRSECVFMGGFLKSRIRAPDKTPESKVR